jgi:hypothetical protein
MKDYATKAYKRTRLNWPEWVIIAGLLVSAIIDNF